MIELTPASTEATEKLGARLAGILPAGCIVYLCGELGAGKTTLVRGLVRALGHAGPVRSPTYTLLELYTLADQQIVHLDLYRLADPEELEFLGLRDFLDGRSIFLVEWPERGRGFLPAADLIIELRHAAVGRVCRLVAASPRGEAVLSVRGTGEKADFLPPISL
ncbi:MAG: tRNA (adenosine(37)-N6)-threonylcarbamoyltransferase complex ATPase subunit type 1 TsaE [Candidatus Competibacteraceae bacterium]